MRSVAAAWILATTLLHGTSLPAQEAEPPPPESLREAAHGRALARIGRSGLRSLLSASGNLGDLQNRAGSYRMAEQLERARTGLLGGRVEALDQALTDPDLTPEERARILALRDDARDELMTDPTYEAAYATATAQVEALEPFGFLGDRPLFLLVRGRGHVRWGGPDGLTVFSEGGSVGPALVLDRWVLAPRLTLGRTDVDVAPFEGRSSSTSLGPALDVGRILGDRWSVALQLARVWAWGESEIRRPSRRGPVEVKSAGWSATTAAKIEVGGRYPAGTLLGRPVSVRPRVGVFASTSYRPPRTNSLGETTTGVFGERESVAALLVGGGLGTTLGAWRPTVYLGWEQELTDQMNALIHDPGALRGKVGMTWSWGRGRQLSVDYSLLRGTSGLRRVSEWTVVAVLDG